MNPNPRWPPQPTDLKNFTEFVNMVVDKTHALKAQTETFYLNLFTVSKIPPEPQKGPQRKISEYNYWMYMYNPRWLVNPGTNLVH